MNILQEFRKYTEAELSRRFVGKKPIVEAVHVQERNGIVHFSVHVKINDTIVIGVGTSQGLAVSAAIASWANEQDDYENPQI